MSGHGAWGHMTSPGEAGSPTRLAPASTRSNCLETGPGAVLSGPSRTCPASDSVRRGRGERLIGSSRGALGTPVEVWPRTGRAGSGRPAAAGSGQ